MKRMKSNASSSVLLLLLLGVGNFAVGTASALAADGNAGGHTFPGGEKPSAYAAAPAPAPHATSMPALRPVPKPVSKPVAKPALKPIEHAAPMQRSSTPPQSHATPQSAPQLSAEPRLSVAEPLSARATNAVPPAPAPRFPASGRDQARTPTNPPLWPDRYPAPYPEARAPLFGRQMAFNGQQPGPRYPAQQGPYPAQYPQPNAPRNSYGNGAPYRQGPSGGNNTGDHLPQWLRQHQNQSPVEQERSLRQEPGFSRLPPQQQQNLINTLHRLNAMPPDQRQRTLGRIENMERLSPQMREAVRNSASQMSALRPDRKRMVQKAFRDLREMPPEERQGLMQSPPFAGQFSAQERSILSNLLAVEPYQLPARMRPYGR